MPNASKGARLYLRKRRGRAETWVILDNEKEVGTGFGKGDRGQAEKALSDYISRKYSAPDGPSDPAQMSVARALEIYGNEHAPDVASPETIGFHIDALLPFWGELPVSAIRGETCRAYVTKRVQETVKNRQKIARVKPATARRELETLSAAINYCHKESYLKSVPRLTLPPKAEAKVRWLTRSEAARLLWAARHAPHLRTFILIGLYTGTRSGAILGLQWLPNTFGGWIDLEAGLLYRGAQGRVETKKRRPICPLPAKLIGHLRRARRRTRRFVIEYDGERVKKLRNSWRSACAAAGLGADVTPHTLRHTAVTWRLLAGVKLWDVAAYVGVSEKMIHDTYGHHAPEFMEEARDAI